MTSGSHLASSITGDPNRPLSRVRVEVQWAGPGTALDAVSGPLSAPGGWAARRLVPGGGLCISCLHRTPSAQGHTEMLERYS